MCREVRFRVIKIMEALFIATGLLKVPVGRYAKCFENEDTVLSIPENAASQPAN
jgi:hypothetical protein